MSNLGPLVRPDIRSLLDSERTTGAVNINKIQVGIVQSFNPAKQSVTVQLVNKRVVGNTPMPGSATPPDPTLYDYPLLVDVPLFVLAGGTAFVGMPVSQGDSCIVLFNDRDLDPWWTNGTTGGAPNTNRIHSLADGIALVGIRWKGDPGIPALPPAGSGLMAIGNSTGTLKAAMDALLTALTSWVNTDSTTPNATTVSALNAAKAKLDALLS